MTSVQIRRFFRIFYFLYFRFLRIQSERRKIRTRKISVFGHFSHNAITIFFRYYNAITAFQLQKIMNRLHSQLQTKSTGSYKIVYITWVFHVFSLSCFNSFFPSAHFLCLLTLFWCFQRLEKRCIGKKWVKRLLDRRCSQLPNQQPAS